MEFYPSSNRIYIINEVLNANYGTNSVVIIFKRCFIDRFCHKSNMLYILTRLINLYTQPNILLIYIDTIFDHRR